MLYEIAYLKVESVLLLYNEYGRTVNDVGPGRRDLLALTDISALAYSGLCLTLVLLVLAFVQVANSSVIPAWEWPPPI